ncbi:MAG TPA: hypothetical protein VHC19_12320 [Pirellulales bacterium]|nr:hypothetical protein [Pirellulales bacterium]
MPIAVSCTSCKAKFTVSDKFAGKQGPCPKCKATITIPALETKPAEPAAKPAAARAGAAPGKTAPGKTAPGKTAPGKTADAPGAAAAKIPAAAGTKPAPAPMPEVVIHAPEEFGPKNAQGRATTKPIARTETKFEVIPAVIISACVLVTLAVTWILRTQLQQNLLMRGGGLLLVSPALAVAAYTFLRDDELEPYRGRWLWLRGTICGLVYMALWGVYMFLPADATAEAYNWIIVGPPFFVVGAMTAYATFDLDFGNGFFHYCFYVLVTLLLGATAGLAMPWAHLAS